jgi:hypothetical protein
MQLLPISKLRALSVEEQDKLARQAGALEKSSKDATLAHKTSFPAIGKVVCVIEERLNELKADRDANGAPKKRQIASNTSLASFWESITKSRLNNHWYSCAVAFGCYVRSELITEADYDKNTAQCLELAASISTAVGGDVTHAAVMAAAEELRDRSKKSAENLRGILDTVKDPKEMTVEQAQKALARILGAGHLNVVIAGIGAEIAHVTDSEMARNAFFGIITAGDMFAANVDETGQRRFSDAVLNAWAETHAKANAKPTEAPSTPAPAPETAPLEQAA